MREEHIGLEHYLYLVRGKMAPGELLQRMHRHVLDGCETCRRHWESLIESQRADVRRLLGEEKGAIPFESTPASGPPGGPSRYATAFSSAADGLRRAATRVQSEKRRARSEIAALLAIAPADREAAIMRSRKRFRSPALAHLLVEDARERVRRSWQEALDLLALADLVLLWIPDSHRSDWGRALVLRIEAHRANTYRVGGELPEADRRFRMLRQNLRIDPLGDPSFEAELASLEASLRWDQRRFNDASELLDQAALTYSELGEQEGLARVLIKRASVQQNLDRPAAALADLEQARRLLDPKRQPFLSLFTRIGMAPILLDLERHQEAEQVLAEAEEEVAARAEPWWTLRLRGLQGRAALAGGDLDRAEGLLTEARDGFLAQGLPQDTANASLDLALVHLHQGRTGKVRALCGEIGKLLAALGVERDALAALTLLQKANEADSAVLAQVALLRRSLQAPPRADRAAPLPS